MMNNTSTTMAILLLATAVVMIGGLIAVPTLQQTAQAQSATHSQSCEEGPRGASFQSCVAPGRNPSNPNSLCDSGREFAGNITGSSC